MNDTKCTSCKLVLVGDKNYAGQYDYALYNGEGYKGEIYLGRGELLSCKDALKTREFIRKYIGDIQVFEEHGQTRLAPTIIEKLLIYVSKLIREGIRERRLLQELQWYRSRLESIWQSFIAMGKKGHFYYIETYA
jgi:hypothetical protein